MSTSCSSYMKSGPRLMCIESISFEESALALTGAYLHAIILQENRAVGFLWSSVSKSRQLSFSSLFLYCFFVPRHRYLSKKHGREFPDEQRGTWIAMLNAGHVDGPRPAAGQTLRDRRADQHMSGMGVTRNAIKRGQHVSRRCWLCL